MVTKSKPCLLVGVLASAVLLVIVTLNSGSTWSWLAPRSATQPAGVRPVLTAHNDSSQVHLQSAVSQTTCPIQQQTCRVPDRSDRDVQLARVMNGFTGAQVKPDNPDLIEKIRTHFIDLPRPYVTKFSMPIVKTPQAKEVDRILQSKRGGFFVECGALDGERSSNSIWFEQKAGWNGLLVEMDPSYYMQVRGKNRKSYSINACLSPETYPTKTQFKEHAMGQGRLVTDPKTAEKSPELIIDTYCFPLYSLMLALNRTRIDYFSLDVEGMELPILRSIPFDKLDIAVLTVEYIHGKSADEYLTFMAKQGYKMVKKLNFVIQNLYLGGNDFVFVREDLL